MSGLFKILPTISACQIKQLSQQCMQQIKKRDDEIIRISMKDRTFRNTIQPYMDNDAQYMFSFNNCSFLKEVSPLQEVRDCSVLQSGELLSFQNKRLSNSDLYNAINLFNEERHKQGIQYSYVEEKYIDTIISNFRRNGVSLSPDKKCLYTKKMSELLDLSLQFRNNLGNDSTELLLNSGELEGCSSLFLESLPKDSDGLYRISLTYPHMNILYTQCKKEDTRRKAYVSFYQRGGITNLNIMKNILRLRQEVSSLLGYHNMGEYMTEKRMSKNPDTVRDFNMNIIHRTAPTVKKNISILKEMKYKDTKNTHFYEYDYLYYTNQYIQQNYHINQEEIREYFPFDHVIQQLFTIVEYLFGLHFEKTNEISTWDPSVYVYKVYNTKDYNQYNKDSTPYTQQQGILFLDLLPRKNKYSYSQNLPLQNPCIYQGKQLLSSSLIISNITPPSSPSSPVYLSHEEVAILFHEMGHAIHQLTSNVPMALLSGMNTQDDFLEVPSTLIEHLIYNPSILSTISCHKTTHQSLPKSMIHNLVQSKLFKTPYIIHDIALFSHYDYCLHTNTYQDIVKVQQDIKSKYGYFDLVPDIYPIASALHLVTDYYICGYYGYNWAELYSSELSHYIMNGNELNKEAGFQVRKELLEKGNTIDGNQMMKNILGSSLSMNSFFKDNGIE
ncbi:hypothetical protein WA158_008291 [Blastocystis sp. Blastoise]